MSITICLSLFLFGGSVPGIEDRPDVSPSSGTSPDSELLPFSLTPSTSYLKCIARSSPSKILSLRTGPQQFSYAHACYSHFSIQLNNANLTWRRYFDNPNATGINFMRIGLEWYGDSFSTVSEFCVIWLNFVRAVHMFVHCMNLHGSTWLMHTECSSSFAKTS